MYSKSRDKNNLIKEFDALSLPISKSTSHLNNSQHSKIKMLFLLKLI